MLKIKLLKNEILADLLTSSAHAPVFNKDKSWIRLMLEHYRTVRINSFIKCY